MQFENEWFLIVSAGSACALWALLWLLQLLKRTFRVPSFFALLTLLLLLAGIAGPYFEKTTVSGSTVALVDVSDSMDPLLSERLLERLRGLGTPVSLIPFAEESSSDEVLLSEVGSYAALRNQFAELGSSQTDIAEAFGRLTALKVERAIVLTDGRATMPRVEESLELLKQERVSLHPLTPEEEDREAPAAELVEVSAPLFAKPDQAVPFQAAIEGEKLDEEGLELVRLVDGEVSERISLSGERSDRELIQFEEDLGSGEGIREVTIELRDRDGDLLDSHQAYVSQEQRERLLLVSGSEQDARYLEQLYADKAYELDVLTGREAAQFEESLSQYFAVILNNIPHGALSERLQEGVAPYVRAGGALLLVGGDKGFGLGGYVGTAIDAASPLRSITPRTEQKRVNAAVQLVLDKSRSMLSNQKIEFAKEAAREVVRNLENDDYIGIIGFDTTPFIAFPMRPVGPNRQLALTRIGTLYPVGKTNLFPAMDEGRRGLKGAKAGRKHMIVLTDGKIPDAGPHYLELVQQLRFLGVTVSTVMMGSEADTRLLRSMAQAGGGTFYQTRDPRALPRIFLSDVRVSTGEKTMRENERYVVRRGPEGIVSTELRSFPELRGFVQTEVRQDARLELTAFAAGTTNPLLASWKFGEGQALAFSSDANGRWSNAWVRWRSFREFWGDLIESVRIEGKGNEGIPEFELRRSVQDGALQIELSIYSEGYDGYPVLTLVGGAAEMAVPLQSQVEGLFTGELPLERSGKLTFELTFGEGQSQIFALWVDPAQLGEDGKKGFDLPRLSSWAAQTGGALNEIVSESSPQTERVPLQNWFLIAAGLLFLLEIFWREGALRPFARLRFA